jgi:hypothetical protein
MQKLNGISSGQNNKSCGIFHHESNKIGFAFFLSFCDLLRNLQETGNHFYYWSSPFAVRTLERSLCLQCDPWARLAGAGEPIPASSPPDLAGEELERGLGTSGGRFGHLAGTVVAPASGAPTARESGPAAAVPARAGSVGRWGVCASREKQWSPYRGSPTWARAGQRGQRGQVSTAAGRRGARATRRDVALRRNFARTASVQNNFSPNF